MGHHDYFQSQNSCFSILLENFQLVSLQISSLLSSPFSFPSDACGSSTIRTLYLVTGLSYFLSLTSLRLPPTPFYRFSVTALFADREGNLKVWVHSTIFTKVSAKWVSFYLYHAIKHITLKVYPRNLNLLRHWRK